MVKRRFSKELWISFGILVGSVIVAAVGLQFLLGKMSADADAIVSDRIAVQGQTNTVAALAGLEAAVPQAAHYQEAMNQLLPDQYGLVAFPQWLSQLGSQYGVATEAALQGSATQAATTTPGTAEFSFTAQGSPQNLIAFLAGMNSKASGFLMELTSFGVTGDGSNDTVTGQGILFFR